MSPPGPSGRSLRAVPVRDEAAAGCARLARGGIRLWGVEVVVVGFDPAVAASSSRRDRGWSSHPTTDAHGHGAWQTVAVTADADIVDDPPAGSGLLLEAFVAAEMRTPGRPAVMSLAVLNNRLLQLTSRRFTPGAYGFPSLREWVGAHADLVRVDTDIPGRPQVAALPAFGESVAETAERRRAAAGASPRPPREPATPQVRTDLWHAVVDYAQGQQWVLGDDGRSRPREDGDAAPALPTLNDDALLAWRIDWAAHARDHTDLEPGEEQQLLAWATDRVSDRLLSWRLRAAWNTRLRNLVAARLESWFSENGMDVPSDLTGAPTRPARTPGPPDDVRDLRDLVLRVVGAMTPSELASLALPAAAVQRAGQRPAARR